MADDEEAQRPLAWRADQVPGLALAVGFVLLVAASLGLASAGGWGGTVALAVLLAAVVAWLMLSAAKQPSELPAAQEDPGAAAALDEVVQPGQH